MADRITLKLQPRVTLGKKVKRLRKAGIIPIHLYGPTVTPRPLQSRFQELIKVLTQAGGSTAISITIDGESEEHLAFVREIQWDPIRGDLFHVDLLRAEANQSVSAEVRVVLTGASPGAREAQGTVVQQLYFLTIEALPLEMPQEVSVNLSALARLDDVIRAGDISLPPGATLVSDPDDLVARIAVARGEVVEEEAPAAGEGQARGGEAQKQEEEG